MIIVVWAWFAIILLVAATFLCAWAAAWPVNVTIAEVWFVLALTISLCVVCWWADAWPLWGKIAYILVTGSVGGLLAWALIVRERRRTDTERRNE